VKQYEVITLNITVILQRGKNNREVVGSENRSETIAFATPRHRHESVCYSANDQAGVIGLTSSRLRSGTDRRQRRRPRADDSRCYGVGRRVCKLTGAPPLKRRSPLGCAAWGGKVRTVGALLVRQHLDVVLSTGKSSVFSRRPTHRQNALPSHFCPRHRPQVVLVASPDRPAGPHGYEL